MYFFSFCIKLNPTVKINYVTTLLLYKKESEKIMRETVLLFHFDDQNRKRELQMFLLSMKLKVQTIKRSEYLKPLGVLAGIQKDSDFPPYDGEDLPTEAIIFCGLSNSRLNELLNGMRKKKMKPIPYKAILTPTNQNWTILECYKELQRERAAIEAAQQAKSPISPAEKNET